MMLPVSAHRSIVADAAGGESVCQRLADFDGIDAAIPVVNNVDVAIVSDPAQIKDALVRQAAAPVRWVETMQAMAAHGVSHVYECGPGKVLAGLVKRCADGLEGGAMADVAGMDAALLALQG